MVCPNCEIKGVTPLTNHDASEQAYKNGYSAGYEAGRRSIGEQKWIPVTEMKPKRDDMIIAFYETMRGTHAEMQIHKAWAMSDTCTHWMPLPEPPNCGADMRGEEDA